MKAVKYGNYGGLDVLKIVEVARPVPGSGQVLVQVKATGINPGEAMVREGLFAKQWPAAFPSGQGSDLAGVVAGVGAGVTGFSIGDEVVGFTNNRASQAEFVAVEAGQLIPRPSGVPWLQAGALFVAGTTAYAAVRAVSLRPGDIVVVAGAAGGVGSIAVQLAKYAGAKVIGVASEANHKWLKSHGIVPVAYGDGMAEKLKAAAGGTINAFIDTYGKGYVGLAMEMGIAPDRVNTIVDFAAAVKYHVKTEGNANAATADVLSKLAAMIAAGHLEVPIAKVYTLSEVREAYRELELRHTHGKIVLIP